jgi:hypothetical protein
MVEASGVLQRAWRCRQARLLKARLKKEHKQLIQSKLLSASHEEEAIGRLKQLQISATTEQEIHERWKKKVEIMLQHGSAIQRMRTQDESGRKKENLALLQEKKQRLLQLRSERLVLQERMKCTKNQSGANSKIS